MAAASTSRRIALEPASPPGYEKAMKHPSWRRFIPIKRLREAAPVVAVLRLHGVIGPRSGPLRPSLDIAGLAGRIEVAFETKRLVAVAISVNSPGGTPAQSALIHDRLRALADEKGLPLHAFVEDVAASGGYWIACAGDDIHANAGSILGSIGVITQGFGFEGALRRLGIERRLYTSGERKSFLDPFLPEREDDVVRLKALQEALHDTFRAHVRARRGGRLKGEEAELFNGEFWTGAGALERGLIDGLGDMRGRMRAVYGEKVKLKLIEDRKGFLQRRLGMDAAAPDLGPLADGLLAAAETRALWARYGL